MQRVAITGAGHISSMGIGLEAIQHAELSGRTCISTLNFGNENVPIAKLSTVSESTLESLTQERLAYRGLDRTTLLSILAARDALKSANWNENHPVAINIGSSRGATTTWEKRFTEFLANPAGQASVYTSPATTLGNISSWVMQDLSLSGADISHSVTCSTAIQAIANGMAWLKSGMAERFLAGASEAPLTPFTLAQMKALKIYSKWGAEEFPCKPFQNPNQAINSMVLGEGAAVFAMERESWLKSGYQALAEIESVGFGTEPLTSPASISEEGNHFQKSMRMALENSPSSEKIDLIISHAPGTIQGDSAELNAIRAVFGENIPGLYSNKWLCGHSLGASAALSLALALNILKTGIAPVFPFPVDVPPAEGKISRIMINAAGFGGNAASMIISRWK